MPPTPFTYVEPVYRSRTPPVQSPKTSHSPIKRVVSFGDYYVRHYDSDSTVEPRWSPEDVPTAFSPKLRQRKLSPDYSSTATSAAMLTRSLIEINREKWANPLILLRKGEVVNYTDCNNQTRWMFTWDLLHTLTSGQGIQERMLITKRGWTISELLRRSTRDLNHLEYTNPLIQRIYLSLAPKIRMKTDSEWLERRMKVRQEKLAKFKATQ
eukprot:CAMPEP_0114518970 /NCGR_PEP_ID=MMETSP0109-20121206/18736_1 /TAXON_ID=29199 /ORGANISM="Chlorarachnion reptans, Strain CCCM449" /LENGTH=210 /DNA_ID=CAMNT_0001699643 /DNA_START=60 /DNA_END=692 /DNA_ORIENTATION=-